MTARVARRFRQRALTDEVAAFALSDEEAAADLAFLRAIDAAARRDSEAA